jgi:CHAD domain-containing protein
VAKALPIEDVQADTPFGEFAGRVIETRAAEAAAAEGVHDRRVAIRRLRTALDVFGPALPKRSRRVRRELKRAASALGPARDAEVAIAALEAFEPRLAAADLPGVRSLIAAFACEPGAVDVASVAEGARALATEASDPTPAAVALRRRAAKRLAAVTARLDALDDPRDAVAVHELRLAAKGLRYTLEAAAPALGPAALDGAAVAKTLQTLLGDLHDADVLLDRIAGHRRELRAEDVEAVCAGGPARNATRYRGVQAADTLVRAHRAGLRERATAMRAPTAEALDQTATALELAT